MSLIIPAQIVGITSALWLSGEIFAYSWGAIPAIALASKTSPSLAGKQWAQMNNRGHSIGPFITLPSTACLAWLAVQSSSPIYAVAAACVLGIVPFTLIFLEGLNGALFEVAGAELKALDGGVVGGLVERWGRVNAVRSVLPLLGGVLGLYAALV